MNEIVYGRDDVAVRSSGGDTITPGTYSEVNDGNPKDHQYNVTPFSAVLAPDTSNTKMLEIVQTEVFREMSISLTNELYNSVLLPNYHEEEDMNQS